MSSAAKQLLREALDHIPDDATVEDVMERLYFLAKVAARSSSPVTPHPATVSWRQARDVRQRPITSSFALALALSLVALPLPAQLRPLTPQEVVGCYGLTRGPWSRPLAGDPRYHALPDTVRLDTLPAEHGGWRLRPDIAYPGGRRFLGTPRWRVKGDSVELLWSNGYQPTVVSLTRRGDGTLRGRVVALSDAHVAGEPPRPSALVTARRVSCTMTLQRPDLHGFLTESI